ncbi:MAG TPA: tRNA 4-thiouridine(8) synthase ThiI, partial [Clostridiales bacterium]|nr:tRNA 4-thiouridine(8) synthase ThiI [Clostridiales bacterium]
MEKVILVRYGEIFLKGRNRSYFVSLLKSNMEHALKDVPHKITTLQTRYIISDFGDNYDK